MAFSLLMHLFVFYSISLLLLFHVQKSQVAKIEILEVRLAQPESSQELLNSRAYAQFKVAQAPIKNPLNNIARPPAPIVEQAPPVTGDVAGIAFPGAVATPFSGQIRSNNSLFQALSARQDAARTYYQQAMEAQARQQSEQQAQLMMQQLQQLLARLLDVDPVVTGRCVLAESLDAVNNILKCDSSALYGELLKDEETVAEMLLALRGMGRMFNGFSAEIHAGKLSITLINEDWGTRKNPSTQTPNKIQ